MKKEIIDCATEGLVDVLRALDSNESSISDKMYTKLAGLKLVNIIRIASDLEVKD